MPLRLRQLEIRLETGQGPFGVRIPFGDGLVVIHADNTSGKSTCLMSALYALGLEGMLGPGQEPPLPPAMKERLQFKGRQVSIQQSEARLEIEGADGAVVTLRRVVTGTSRERQIITVSEGPAISSPGRPYKRVNYFVRVGGSAQREAGFHRFLAAFMGLDLPEIQRFDGEKSPLYLECLFPYFFVEQITGWRDLKTRMPTYLQIPEMAKRSAEYVMRLDVLYRSLRRQDLQQAAKQVDAKWSAYLEQSVAGHFGLGFVIRGIPESPVEQWPPSASPNLFIADDAGWKRIEEVLEKERARLQRLVEVEIPRAETTTAASRTAIKNLELVLQATEHEYHQIHADVVNEQEQLSAINERLKSLKEDRRKYQDEQMLRERGVVGDLKLQSDHCPVCDRPLADVLLPQTGLINPMSLEENLGFVTDQIRTFEYMIADAGQVLDAKQQLLSSFRDRINNINAQIRTEKETLRSDGRLPSAAAIRERLQSEARLERLEAIHAAFVDRMKHIATLAAQWRDIQKELKELKSGQLSSTDVKKLNHVGTSFTQQLQEYGFSSFPLAEVGISQETYRPSQNGYDFGITSASDTIRTIWAYLIAILELARSMPTNHLGLLVFDEPRQQSTADLSFQALMMRASTSRQFGQQVIFATSQERATLMGMLKGIPCNYLRFDGKMLAPLKDAPPTF